MEPDRDRGRFEILRGTWGLGFHGSPIQLMKDARDSSYSSFFNLYINLLLTNRNHRANASFGRPPKFSSAWRPTSPVGWVFLCSSAPSSRTLLPPVAGPFAALVTFWPENGPSWAPEPTPTVSGLAVAKSLATGGCSGSGRLDLCSSTSLLLSVFWSITDCSSLVRLPTMLHYVFRTDLHR